MNSPPTMQWSTENCTLERAASIFGDRASLLVLREVSHGVRRFANILARTGIPRQVLTNRLAGLVDDEILRRQSYQVTGQRPRFEYRFTDKGLALIPILVALMDWGNAYAADPDGPPVTVVHHDCGGEVHAALVCEHGHVLEGNRATRVRPGPGARPLQDVVA